MNWFNSMMASMTIREAHSTILTSETTAEIVMTGIGGIVTGATIGSIFGPIGTTVGMYIGLKAGTEGIQAGIKAIKDYDGR